MKTVFSNAMCAHVWAQLSQPHGRGASMSFQGATLCSYRTPIAAIAEAKDGTRVALFTSLTFSMTTSSKHMPDASRAWSGARFTVPCVTAYSAADHNANADYLAAEYATEAAALLRVPADSYRIARYNMVSETCTDASMEQERARSTLSELADIHGRYCAAFGLERKALPWIKDAGAAIARRDRLMADPKRVVRMAAAEAKRAAAQEVQRVYNASRDAIEREKNADKLAAWLRGDDVYLPYAVGTDADGNAYLRVRDGMVETSLSASAPVKHVQRTLIIWRQLVDSNALPWTRGEYASQDAATVLGHFKLDAINADGSVRAGCHRIARAQVEKIERELQP